VKTLQHSAYWAVFKLTVFRAGGHDLCLYFACTGGNAYKERDRWVEKMGTLVSQVTRSLFPPSDIKVQPLPGIESTSTRILAGFLLQGCNMDTCQLVYAELHAYVAGEAKLILYRDEWCDREAETELLEDLRLQTWTAALHPMHSVFDSMADVIANAAAQLLTIMLSNASTAGALTQLKVASAE
ncbi:Caltractin, partial [Symbiodinium pilosum]